jgi:hypothetical protein
MGVINPSTTMASAESLGTTINPVYDIVFYATVGICLSLIALLIIILTVMIVYTKYKVWKSRVRSPQKEVSSVGRTDKPPQVHHPIPKPADKATNKKKTKKQRTDKPPKSKVQKV